MKKDKNKTENNNNITVSEKPTGFTVIMREIKKDKFAIISLIILGVLFLTIFIGAFLTNQEEVMKISLLDKYAAPGEGFYLGADSGGRDILGQLIIGARNSIIIVDSTLALAGNIGIETGLSFLGFGLPPSIPSLGTLVGYATDPEVLSSKLWIWLPASILILIMMLCINYVGQALKRAADARQRLG